MIPLTLPPNSDAATYTTADVARLLQCSERHVSRLVKQHLVPGRIQLGRLVRFRKFDVDQWIAGRGANDATASPPPAIVDL